MQRIGPWQILGELGRGGLGVVYRARRDDGPGQAVGPEVALKVPTGLDPEDRLRFVEEARALRRLRAPGVAAIVEADLAGPTPYLAMELVRGETLQERLQREGPASPREAVGLALELTRTLRRLHAAGVVHRDLKPGNVILRAQDGAPVLIDLGLALLLDRSSRLTRSGELMGTPVWMSPEQARGELGGMGPATDVYGLGAVLYGLLVGEAPFAAGQLLQVLHDVLHLTPAPPSRRRVELHGRGPAIDPRLDELVRRCLLKRPAERPELTEVERVLEALLEEQPRAQAPPARRRSALVVGLPVAGLLLAGLVGGAGLAWETRPAPPAPHGPAPEEDAPGEATAEGESVAALCSRARGLMGDGEFEAAAPLLERAAALAPRDPLVLAALGGMRAHLNDYAGAVRDLDAALALDPRCLEALLNRGALRERQDELELALRDYDLAVQLDPAHARVLVGRASVRGRLGQRAEALADLTRAMELDPLLPDPWIERGFLHLADKDVEGALADVNRGLELDPRHARGFALRGTIKLQLNDVEGARRDLDRALELAPRAIPALEARGLVSARAGDLPSALADWRRAIALLPPEGPDAERLRGWIARLEARPPR